MAHVPHPLLAHTEPVGIMTADNPLYPARAAGGNKKTCRKCDRPHGEVVFEWRIDAKDGLRSECVGCRAAQKRAYCAANREREHARNKIWRAANRERVAAYERKRQTENLPHRLALGLRNRIRQAVRQDAKSGSAVADLGCTIPELKAHLEARFAPGMTWENWGRKGWHIDHIRPLAKFDLTKREELLAACHYTNLQPLWAEKNLSKGAR